MAKKKAASHPASMSTQDKWKMGHLYLIDNIPAGDPQLAGAINMYADYVNTNKQSRHWVRAVQWIENILFSMGRQYVDDMMISRLTRDTNNDLSVISDVAKMIPKPVNDLLGRYVETNIALLTENRPRPRVTPKSNKTEDEERAELSEWVLEYLWEALDMPELHRELARIILHCGAAWMEITHDPAFPRRIATPETAKADTSIVPMPGGEPVEVPIPRNVVLRDEETNEVKYTQQIEYGELTAKAISPFEMHFPSVHWWNGEDLDWVMRESYATLQSILDKYTDGGKNKRSLTKKNGWYLENLAEVGPTNVRQLPIWWWERLTDLVEGGAGPSLYTGAPDQWEGYTTVRVFDRKPCPMWPQGRTIMIVGDKVLYDSPKNVGARAYDPRWPTRWHPYVRFRWEAQVGSIYGRSLVSKLLPKLKRVNAIDTTLIMWRRTVPIACWVSPKGAHPVEDSWLGMPGNIYEYDPRLTNNQKPEPVYPAEYPKTALEERQMQIAEMEAIAGTEEVLRGQRPAGTTSAVMLDILRKQALASRSATLQAWDESLQLEGSILLQEVIKNVRNDPRYMENLRIIARDKQSSRTIEKFTGSDLSDNVQVRVDTASLALVSKEAREAKMLEIMQYLPNLMTVPLELRVAMFEELGLKNKLQPQSADVTRAKKLLGLIRQGDFDRVIPYDEDDPYVFYDLFVEEMKSDAFFNLDNQQQMLLLSLIDVYKRKVEVREQQKLKMQQIMAATTGGGAPPEQMQ